jgi:hypothetical protein
VLEEELPDSRSTIDRGVRELETFDFLRYTEEGYEPAVCGQLAAEEYRRFHRRMTTLLELRPFLQWFPASEFDMTCLEPPRKGKPSSPVLAAVRKGVSGSPALLPASIRRHGRAALDS